MNRDTLLIPISDLHSGSNYALFPNKFMEFEHGGNHTPNSKQELIYSQWERYIEQVANERKGKRLVVVVNGDAIEGLHHTSVDVCTHDIGDQMEIHKELMVGFMKSIKWQRGDLLYYVRGTETHTANIEHSLAESLGAQQHADGEYIADHLSLEINGRRIWFVHEGARAGSGANEGNTLRNWLRDIYFNSLKSKVPYPDVVYSGHVHTATYNNYVANDNGNFVSVHGVILPSWKAKDRFTYKVASVAENRIGGVTQEISSNGDIRIPKFCTVESESITKVVI